MVSSCFVFYQYFRVAFASDLIDDPIYGERFWFTFYDPSGDILASIEIK